MCPDSASSLCSWLYPPPIPALCAATSPPALPMVAALAPIGTNATVIIAQSAQAKIFLNMVFSLQKIL